MVTAPLDRIADQIDAAVDAVESEPDSGSDHSLGYVQALRWVLRLLPEEYAVAKEEAEEFINILGDAENNLAEAESEITEARDAVHRLRLALRGSR